MSKATKILNASDIETNDTMEQNWKTKGNILKYYFIYFLLIII